MRVKISKSGLSQLFNALYGAGKTMQDVADQVRIGKRTINDWKRGSFTIPLDKFRILTNIAGIDEGKLSPKIVPDFWHVKDAATKGAKARMALYGNFGTPDGRSRGGKTSIKMNIINGTRFKTLKLVHAPSYSENLAELIGIFLGDGHLSKYQASITTNSKTDYDHAIFSRNLIKKLFGISATIKKKKDENTLNVVASSKNLVHRLHSLGMPIGNKIQNNLSVPFWIYSKPNYQRAFIRGLFDTDGCIYLDNHKINKKSYKYLGWTITSYADKLITDLLNMLRNLGFSPTHSKTQKSVYLRKSKEIARYFIDIGTSNPKHKKRYKKFIGGFA